MKDPAELWVYLSASPLLWLCLTLVTWMTANRLSVVVHRHPLANPVLISIVLLSTLLVFFHTPYEQFFNGAQFIHFLLGPATVALAVPFFRQRHYVRRLILPVAAALIAGSVTAILSVAVIGGLAGLPHGIIISALPKSATAGVAMSISSTLGGNPSLTAILVILTGIFGAVVVTPMMNLMGITDYAARGFAIGLTSHGIGTARAYNVDQTAGVFAGIAMALNAVATTVIVPFAAHLLLS